MLQNFTMKRQELDMQNNANKNLGLSSNKLNG